MERGKWRAARLWSLAAIVAVCIIFVADGIRLVSLHLGKQEIKQNNYRQKRELLGLRGSILDRNGQVLAESLPGRIVYIDRDDPKLDAPGVDRAALPLDLAELLGVPEERVRDAFFNEAGRRTTRICEISDNAIINELIRRSSPKMKEGRIAGVNFAEQQSVRSHPNGARLAHVLGFINAEGAGVQGVEQRFDAQLRGKDGQILTYVDAGRREIRNRRIDETPPEHGDDIVLTIDNNVQYIIETALEKALKDYQADSGIIIVQDAHSGEIYGMATQPSFDPQDYNHQPQQAWRNAAVSRSFEPGSVMKGITVAMAMQMGVISERSTFDVGTSRVWYYAGRPLRDHATGILTTAGVLAQSSNIGTAQIGLMMAEPAPQDGYPAEYERLWRAFRSMGFGEKTGIEIPGEELGLVPHFSDWSKLSPTRMPLGHGIAVTAVQLCNAYATLANGGVRMRPTILKEIRKHDGTVEVNPPEVLGRPLKPEVAAKMLEMLRGVTDRSKRGTAWRAALPNYTVAGKTGTAQIPIPGRGYNDTDYNASFVGIYPSTAPRLVVLVSLERPKGSRHSGGNVAAPIFAEIAEPIAFYLNIPADKSTEGRAK